MRWARGRSVVGGISALVRGPGGVASQVAPMRTARSIPAGHEARLPCSRVCSGHRARRVVRPRLYRHRGGRRRAPPARQQQRRPRRRATVRAHQDVGDPLLGLPRRGASCRRALLAPGALRATPNEPGPDPSRSIRRAHACGDGPDAAARAARPRCRDRCARRLDRRGYAGSGVCIRGSLNLLDRRHVVLRVLRALSLHRLERE
jgi:hypothetical protein